MQVCRSGGWDILSGGGGALPCVSTRLPSLHTWVWDQVCLGPLDGCPPMLLLIPVWNTLLVSPWCHTDRTSTGFGWCVMTRVCKNGECTLVLSLIYDLSQNPSASSVCKKAKTDKQQNFMSCKLAEFLVFKSICENNDGLIVKRRPDWMMFVLSLACVCPSELSCFRSHLSVSRSSCLLTNVFVHLPSLTILKVYSFIRLATHRRGDTEAGPGHQDPWPWASWTSCQRELTTCSHSRDNVAPLGQRKVWGDSKLRSRWQSQTTQPTYRQKEQQMHLIELMM